MEKLWTTAEVARHLGINPIDVGGLVREGTLTGYKLGGQFLRFRPDQVEALKATMRFRRGQTKPAARPSPSWAQRLQEFIYFYDFYLISVTLLAVLVVYLIVAGHGQ